MVYVTDVIRITPPALSLVHEILAKEPDAKDLALCLEVNGSLNGVYTYDLWFGPKGEIPESDHQQLEGDLVLAVPAGSVEALQGAVLDLSDRGDEPGLVIINANKPPMHERPVQPQGDLSGPLAQRVLAVLEAEINPQIATHGGHVDLVSVQDSTAYVEMSGGCQGCGMARATLSQGVAVAIADAVPEITDVVDVTDHLSGANPFI